MTYENFPVSREDFDLLAEIKVGKKIVLEKDDSRLKLTEKDLELIQAIRSHKLSVMGRY